MKEQGVKKKGIKLKAWLLSLLISTIAILIFVNGIGSKGGFQNLEFGFSIAIIFILFLSFVLITALFYIVLRMTIFGCEDEAGENEQEQDHLEDESKDNK